MEATMIGIDIVEVKRIKKVLDKHNSFLKKIFNEEELKRIEKRKNPYERIAGMYAAKEAVSKAMGTGIGKISFKDIKLKYNGDVPTAEVKNLKFLLSISHERKYAVAIAKIKNKKIKINSEIKNMWINREDNSHKGDYGKIAIIAGSIGMTGSCFLSSNAAIKSGAGLVYNIVPREILDIMSIKYVEPIAKSFEDEDDLNSFLEGMDAIAMGPGMGLEDYGEKTFKNIIKTDKNLLIDADGLNLLSRFPETLKDRKNFTTILTPHEGEFKRLTGLSLEEIKNNREKVSINYARKNKVILVLKGHNTVVTDGDKIYINNTGNPGMATAGSGDVLTGIISAFMKNYNLFDAAKLGVYIHGLSGDLYRDINSMTSLRARNIIENLDVVFNLIEN